MRSPSPLEPLGGPVGSRTLIGCLFAGLLWLCLLAVTIVTVVWAIRYVLHG